MNERPLPLRVLLQAPPEAPGAPELLAEAELAAADGRELAILLVDGGLAWAESERLARLAASPGVRVALCSRSARDEGIEPEHLPDWVRWSSLVAWLRDHDPSGPLWGLFP